jgi:hypothetical protein
MIVNRLVSRLQVKAAEDEKKDKKKDEKAPSSEVKSPTSTETEVRSPTSTSTEVRSPTSTSTDAYTQGNVTVTGGAGDGATIVYICQLPPHQPERADHAAHQVRSIGSALRAVKLMEATSSTRTPPPDLKAITNKERAPSPDFKAITNKEQTASVLPARLSKVVPRIAPQVISRSQVLAEADAIRKIANKIRNRENLQIFPALENHSKSFN